MPITFTICSNNYLAKARITAESFLAKHPAYTFLIFLVDEFIPEIDYNFIPNVKIIAVKDVVPDMEGLAKKYSIVELNTAVKPAIFTYLFTHYDPGHIIFLDPDLLIYDHFTEVEDLIIKENYNIVVTPHFCSPIDDGKVPSEVHFTPYGIYNLGFLALKNTAETSKFLEWWHDRLMKYCYIDPENGMFTDQLWVNYAPVFFKGVYILKHLGYNIANWNLYERPVDKINDTYYINGTDKLKFFHFSHYKFHNPYIISSQHNRHQIDDLKYMRAIVDEYQSLLISNKQEFFAVIHCYYQQRYEWHRQVAPAEENRFKNILRRAKNKVRRFVPEPVKRLIKKIK